MVSKGIGAAAVIVNDAGEILLVKHTYGRLNWELPGGGAEASESPMETATREVREETGLTVAVQHLTGVYYAADNDSVHFVFWCAVQGKVTLPQADQAEISECRYFPSNALPRPISDWTLRRIQDALRGEKATLPVCIGPRVWLE